MCFFETSERHPRHCVASVTDLTPRFSASETSARTASWNFSLYWGEEFVCGVRTNYQNVPLCILICQYVNRTVQKVSERYINALQVPSQPLPPTCPSEVMFSYSVMLTL
jgi:hypothetical protein